jgi:hypothetical protein
MVAYIPQMKSQYAAKYEFCDALCTERAKSGSRISVSGRFLPSPKKFSQALLTGAFRNSEKKAAQISKRPEVISEKPRHEGGAKYLAIRVAR